MSDARPVRMRLFRTRGFDLQAASLALNGLPAVRVARPGKWGNHYRIGINCTSVQEAVVLYRAGLEENLASPSARHTRHALHEHISDRNLACWCALDQPCHADVLLELANAPLRCEAA